MSSQRKIRDSLRRILALNNLTIAILVVGVFLGIIAIVYYSQKLSEQASLAPIITTGPKEQYEIAKLAAEMAQIRSDTSGGLFWLKMIALFVTVGGAVGGYLVGQGRITKRRIDFENRKNTDAAYQTIVQELSDKSPLLRAAAAVKLGAILRSFPQEWADDSARGDERKGQLIQLTKQVLAASLAMEDDEKVLKILSIALVLHKPWEDDPEERRQHYGDGRGLDLSGVKAEYAYWAKVDFTNSDFFRAELKCASLRGSILQNAQFCETKLGEAVLAYADCRNANFKLADLRGADLTGARVHGCKMPGAQVGENPDAQVDDSPEGDGSVMVSAREWLRREAGRP